MTEQEQSAQHLKWFVLRIHTGYEKHVIRALNEMVELNQLQGRVGDVLVPTEEVVEMKGGQRRKSQRRFFPGYVLIQLDMDEQVWHLVKSLPKVIGFVGGSREQPRPISDAEAQAILDKVQTGADKPRPKVLYEPGEVVRVTEGPFADFNGVVEEVDYENSRLKVSVLIFGRSTPIDLNFSQVAKG